MRRSYVELIVLATEDMFNLVPKVSALCLLEAEKRDPGNEVEVEVWHGMACMV